jgi:hypothetical protein
MRIKKTRVKAGECCKFCMHSGDDYVPSITGEVECDLDVCNDANGSCTFFKMHDGKARKFERWHDEYPAKETLYEDEIDPVVLEEKRKEYLSEQVNLHLEHVASIIHELSKHVTSEMNYSHALGRLIEEYKDSLDLEGLRNKLGEISSKSQIHVTDNEPGSRITFVKRRKAVDDKEGHFG